MVALGMSYHSEEFPQQNKEAHTSYLTLGLPAG
jgi:hypothetical protein